jgi:hypothetical protein
MDSPLGIFLFEYLVLGIIFVVGLIYAIRQGDVGLRRGRPRKNLVMLLSGYVLYMAVHGFFQFIAVDF